MKKYLFISIILFSSVIIIQCKSNNIFLNKTKKEVIVADHYRGFDECFEKIVFYNDSTYVFAKFEKYSKNNDNLEKYYGKFIIEKDTILFLEHGFLYLDCKKAVVKNNFINFIYGKKGFLKLKIKKTIIDFNEDTNFAESEDFAFFINDKNSKSNFYFKGNVKPYDLNQNDLGKIEILLNKCINENNKRLPKPIDYYKKNCIAVINSNNEIEVFVDCTCKTYYRNSESLEEFRYGFLSGVSDGGYCFFSVKINLTLQNYKELHINSDG